MTFTFKLERPETRRSTPPEISLGVYVWHPGDVIHLGAGRSLRVVDVRGQDEDEPVVLVVEDV